MVDSQPSNITSSSSREPRNITSPTIDQDGKTIADPHKFSSVIKAVERAQQNPTKENYIYAVQLLRDAFPDSKIPTSVWDDPEEVLSHLQ